MPRDIEKVVGNLIFLSLIGLIVYGYISASIFTHHFIITAGTVVDINSPGYQGSGNYAIRYTFVVDKKIYRGSQNFNSCSNYRDISLRSFLVGKAFPVAYGKGDPATCAMLLTYENAQRFDYVLPDSLRLYDSILTCK